ncbi:RluA family pseudouridine synthase [uncultured Negativibacillus sp.]|uniref:RluA family pseudouridine synthase n=1 Tax=uncultured Negativibacillus sp. TaxID=1980696 RepID=UPI0025F063FC|nr:RluA family pseudouridine synthase [uncultured Negativibacillus sp.]
MRTLRYQIAPEHEGMNVERYLKQQHGYSSRTIVKLKHYEQGMRLNGAHTRTIDLLHAGDVLEITFLDSEEHGVEHFIRSNRQVEIAYEDDDLLVFNKPADMPCHQSCGHAADTLANVFAAHCDQLGMDLMYRPLNRLDRDTSGAVLIAKNRFAAASVTNNFHKTYQAILDGVPPQSEGRVDAPIRREFPEEMRRIVSPDGQRAITNYRVLAVQDGYSLVDFVLETGRTHQIRVHMAHLGCPVLGDSMYGRKSEMIARQALHCRYIAFTQPVSRQPVGVSCTMPEDMQEVCTKLGLKMNNDV